MAADVNTGIFTSTLVMLFIILSTGVFLYNAGIRNIETVDQAAKALAPLAGKFSYVCFALGVLGTCFLAIPVLTGSLCYILAESFGWEEGLDKKFNKARAFYFVIIISFFIGLLINVVGVSPMQVLIFTAILYGVSCCDFAYRKK
jgi:Mn2+/Fe2+ NRAMP family transporter